MPTFSGYEVIVKVATTESGLETASPVPYITHIEFDVTHNITAVPKGLGDRRQELKEGLLEYSGRIERSYDTTAIAGSDHFFKFAQALATGEQTQGYMQIQIGANGKKYILKKLKFDNYHQEVDADGIAVESGEFMFEEISET
jgi:hypothetical protein